MREINIIVSDGTIFSESGEIAQKLSENFAAISSEENYNKNSDRLKGQPSNKNWILSL